MPPRAPGRTRRAWRPPRDQRGARQVARSQMRAPPHRSGLGEQERAARPEERFRDREAGGHVQAVRAGGVVAGEGRSGRVDPGLVQRGRDERQRVGHEVREVLGGHDRPDGRGPDHLELDDLDDGQAGAVGHALPSGIARFRPWGSPGEYATEAPRPERQQPGGVEHQHPELLDHVDDRPAPERDLAQALDGPGVRREVGDACASARGRSRAGPSRRPGRPGASRP